MTEKENPKITLPWLGCSRCDKPLLREDMEKVRDVSEQIAKAVSNIVSENFERAWSKAIEEAVAKSTK